MSVALSVTTTRVPDVDTPRRPGTLTGVLLGIHAERANTSSTRAAVSLEIRDRVRAGLANSGQPWPNHALALTATTPLLTSSQDLAVAIAVCLHTGAVPPQAGRGVVFAAEVGIDGRLRPIPRLELDAAVRAAAAAGHRAVITAADAGAVTAPIAGVSVHGARDLSAVLAWLRGHGRLRLLSPDTAVLGAQLAALGDGVLAAVEVAAAGGHRLGVIGAATPDRDLPAHQLRLLLPAPAPHPPRTHLDGAAPLVVVDAASASIPDLTGRPMSREIGALEHAAGGVLTLAGAEAMAAPVRDSVLAVLAGGTVSRMAAEGRVTRIPISAQLVTTMTGCACPGSGPACTCTPVQIRARRAALTRDWPGQIWIRIDPAPAAGTAPRAATAGECVAAARAAALDRWGALNAEVPGAALLAHPLDAAAVLTAHVRNGEVRAAHAETVLRVAWTLADHAGHPEPTAGDIADAARLCIPPETGDPVRTGTG